VLPEREVAVARADAGGPPEVVDGHRVHPRLGEALRQLLVEAVEAPDVGEDDRSGVRTLVRVGEERTELGAVGRGQHQVVALDRASPDRRQGRTGVVSEAHGPEFLRSR
jgi:hypothetical protein